MADGISPSQNRGAPPPVSQYDAIWNACDEDRTLRFVHGHEDWRSDGEVVSNDEVDCGVDPMRNPPTMARNGARSGVVSFSDNPIMNR